MTSPNEENDDQESNGSLISRIVISRWIDSDGEDIITTDRGDCSRLEVLGLLNFAAHTVWWSDQKNEEG